MPVTPGLVNQLRSPTTLGYLANSPTGVTTVSINSATVFLGLGFVLSKDKTLNTIRVYLSSVTGTIITSNVTCDIYSDSSGSPNVSIAGPSNASSITGATWIEFTFSQALTAGVQYWAVIKNVNGTPASNFPAIQFSSADTVPFIGANAVSGSSYGWVKKQWNGATWGTPISPVGGYRLAFSDGSYDGLPIQSITTAPATDRVYSTRESGAYLVTPANGLLNVSGISFFLRRSGNPTGSLIFKMYNGTTLIGTTNSVALPFASGSTGWVTAYFSSPVSVAGGVTLRITIAETAQSDTSSNYFNPVEINIDSDTYTDTDRQRLVPLFGNWKKTYYDGSSWTETTATFPAAVLLLDTSGEFGSTGGGGFVTFRRPRHIEQPLYLRKRHVINISTVNNLTATNLFMKRIKHAQIIQQVIHKRRTTLTTPAPIINITNSFTRRLKHIDDKQIIIHKRRRNFFMNTTITGAATVIVHRRRKVM